MPYFEIAQDNEAYRWEFIQGSPNKPGEVIAVSPRSWDNVTAVRAHIAASKLMMRAARMSKVVVA